MDRSPDVWDLVVVGGGTAGLVASVAGAQLGARVALVERDRTGGECLYRGCVPSKALLHIAGQVAAARSAHRFFRTAAGAAAPDTSDGAGVGAVGAGADARAVGAGVDMVAVLTHVRRAIETIETHDSPEFLQDNGVTLLPGTATFTGPRALSVDGRPHRFHRAVLATGSSPIVPDIPGLAAAEPLTSDTVWDLAELPGRLLVLGGGPIGCELSQAFARLGSAVTLVQSAERVLPRVDPDASRVVHAALERDGAEVRVGARVTAVQSGVAVISAGGRVPFDRVLVAVGVRPVTDGLGLDRAGVDLDAGGAVRVDARLRTTNEAIYAAGDVTQHRKLTHLASYHAGLAASNAVLGTRLATTSAVVPEVIYTDPEVATVGDPTWAAGGGTTRRTITHDNADVDRAVTDGAAPGFVRLALGGGGLRVRGATIVGPRAGESIAELVVVIRQKVSLLALSSTVHAYPTYGYGPWEAAVAEVRRRSGRFGLFRLTRLLVLLRRATLRRTSSRPE